MVRNSKYVTEGFMSFHLLYIVVQQEASIGQEVLENLFFFFLMEFIFGIVLIPPIPLVAENNRPPEQTQPQC